MIERTSSSVGGVVDVERIESLPLNGRQFANAAITIPGVGLGFHSDPTKSTQCSPQIAGGNGRNVNYQIDGGDNNDDTVGGLLQLFPLEAIQEFNFVTQRYKAEYGRSNGGVMNIVTKSGTNQMRGSWFTNLRDKDLNAKTMTEKLNNVSKQPIGGISTAARSAGRSSRTARTSSRPTSAPAGHAAGGDDARAGLRRRTASTRRRAARTSLPGRCRRTSRLRSSRRCATAGTPTRRSTTRRPARCPRTGATASTPSTRST